MKQILLILGRVKWSMAENVSSLNKNGYLRYYGALNPTPTVCVWGGGGGEGVYNWQFNCIWGYFIVSE